jgi:hypothetical protein
MIVSRASALRSNFVLDLRLMPTRPRFDGGMRCLADER